MKDENFRCEKCGAFEAVFEEENANPFDIKPPRIVCKKCGHIHEADSDVSLINRKTVNPFPSPSLDLDTEDSLTEKIKSKRWVH